MRGARERTTGAVGRVRDTSGAVRDRATATADQASGRAQGAAGGPSALLGAAGSGGGSAGTGSASGSAAGAGEGMFFLGGTSTPALDVGTRVEDARGRLVGHLEQVNRNARGRIESVAVRVGDRIATLPASNFSAGGDVLFSAMGKGAVKDAAKEQEQD